MRIKIQGLGGVSSRSLAVAVRDERGEHTITESRRDMLNTEEAMQTEFRSKFPSHDRDEVHVHKNRDGTFVYVVGRRPRRWPEDWVV
jgi:hypothetical protein